MGIRSFAVVAALAASQLALVSACGWANERCCGNTCKVDGLECKGGWCVPDDGCGGDGQECCDIHPNDPNRGTCNNPDELVCWEGTCGRCGMNGKMACPGGVCLDECLEANKDGWCSEIPNCRSDFGDCEPACGDGETCKWNRCIECGGLWQPPCEEGCDDLLAVRESDDICAYPEPTDICNVRYSHYDIDAHDMPGSGIYKPDIYWCEKVCRRTAGCNAIVFTNRRCYLKQLDMTSTVNIFPKTNFYSRLFCP